MNNNEVTPEDPRMFLIEKGLGDLVLNPHKSHREWVYASDAMKEYTQSLLVERDKRIAELETISADDDHVILILQDQLKISEERIKELENQNERLKAMVKEAEEIGGYRF